MKLRAPALALTALALAFGVVPARASTWFADCTNGLILKDSVSQLSGLMATNTLGFSLFGTPLGPGQLSSQLVPGDLIEINGICTEDVTVRNAGLTLANHTNSGSFTSVDGVQGQLEIASASGTSINGVALSAPATFSDGEVANLFVHDSSAVTLQNAQVNGGPFIGVFATRSSGVALRNTTVSGNGAKGVSATSAMGILAADNATIVLGKNDGTQPATVQGNFGPGIVVNDGSSIVAYAATITNNGNQLVHASLAGPQVFLLGTSSGFFTGSNAGTTVISPGSNTCCQTISATGSSTLQVEQGVAVTGNENNAAIGLNAATLLLQGSFISSGAGNTSGTAASAEPTINASGNAVIALAGGNAICFGTLVSSTCTAIAKGVAIQVAHVSTLIQIAGSVLGYSPAVDQITGTEIVVLQSTVDLGLGNVSSTPGINWNTGPAGTPGIINVEQNSSFRLQGGVTITGKVQLTQASNGFFNNGSPPNGINTVTQGVLCPYTTVPAAHVSVAGVLSPTPPTLATSMASVPKTFACLSF